MKGISLRKDGRYVVRRTIGGKRIIRYAKTLKEAQKIYSSLKKNIKLVEKEKVVEYTLKKWNLYWLETFKKPFIIKTTYMDIKAVLKIINSKLGNVDLKELKTLQIQTFLNSLPKGRKKERIQTYFNASLQKAEDLNILIKNPFKAVIREKKGKYRNYAYKFDEQEKILNAIKGTEIEHEIYIYLMTGCRPLELPKSENFDFENKIVTINGTKNANALKRTVELSDNFIEYIKPYIEKNIRPTHRKIVEEFNKICKSVNIQKPLLYRLRHTFASNHFALKTNAKYVQMWLGHYSISITMDVYTDIDKSATREKIQKLYNNFYYEVK